MSISWAPANPQVTDNPSKEANVFERTDIVTPFSSGMLHGRTPSPRVPSGPGRGCDGRMRGIHGCCGHAPEAVGRRFWRRDASDLRSRNDGTTNGTARQVYDRPRPSPWQRVTTLTPWYRQSRFLAIPTRVGNLGHSLTRDFLKPQIVFVSQLSALLAEVTGSIAECKDNHEESPYTPCD